ncbi:hypothetical protein [Deinococcus radiophilus]|uniref:hypothetical protein n=1 Tax=Deinococcus radiophilus TaxID=32062 RepID=UPI001E576E0D|nr:hypothetical protein [Deinococcus radiophilus]UFA49660.1 hypothetical protein LMT64_07070 [Deinococcus radiophilus]
MSYIRGTPLHIKPGAKLTVQLTRPYQSGTQLSQARYEATWDGSKWVDLFTQAELNIPMPRQGKEGPQASGDVHIYITQDPNSRDTRNVARLTYDASTWGETAPGELNLTVNPRPIAWVATAGLLERLNSFDGTAQAAISAAELEAQRAEQFAADAERASWDAVALAATGAGRKSAVSLAEMPMEASVYNIINGAEAGQTWERLADGSQVRRPELEAASKTALDEAVTETRSEIAAVDAAKVSVDVFQQQRTAIPLIGLSSSDPTGDFQQRVADAQATKKPLDGAGGVYEMALSSAVDMTGTVIRNASLRVDGAVSGGYLRLDLRSQVQTLTETFQGTLGARQITLPGHACRPGDLLYIYGTEQYSVGRPEYKTGEARRVLYVADANNVIVDRGLQFAYTAQYPGKVVRRGRELHTGGFDGTRLEYIGAGNRRGVELYYGDGQLASNAEFVGWRERALMMTDTHGTVSATRIHDGYYDGTNNSYGASVVALSDVDFVACHMSAGRHNIAGGGGYPGIYRVTGGSYRGGHLAGGPALDAHGNMWSLSINGAEVYGGISTNAMHSKITNSHITAGASGCLYALDEAPAGASIRAANTSMFRAVGQPAAPMIRLVRAWAQDNTTNSIPDVRYGTVSLVNVDCEYHGGSQSEEIILDLNASLKKLEIQGSTWLRVGNPGAQKSSISYNRIEHIDIDGLVLGGERLVTARATKVSTATHPILEASPKSARFRVVPTGVGGYAASGALDLVAAADLPWGDLEADITAKDNPSLPLRVRYFGRLRLRQISSGNAYGAEVTAGQYQVGAWIGDGTELHVSPDTIIDETVDPARFGLALSNVGRVVAPSARVRGRLGSIYVAAGTPVWERSNLREATGAADWPTLTGSLDSTASVAASATSTFSIPVPGAAVGDIPQISPPANLSADVSFFTRIAAAGNVQVVVRNHTAATVSIAGTWRARVSRS